jgi:hypothetical protein
MKAWHIVSTLRRSTREMIIGTALLVAVLAVGVAMIGPPPQSHVGAQRPAPAPCGAAA